MYPVNFLGLGRGLDFLLPSFLVSRQGPYRGREVFPGTFLRWILYSSLSLDPFSRFIMYPASFPGLGRGLDFLLFSFLVSRQEKKVEARWIRPTEYHFNDDECAKRDTFLGYKDLIIWKRITFLCYSFHRWNVCGAYAIRPYRVIGKHIAFLRYNDLIIRKRITFWIFIFDEWWKRGSFSGYNNHIIRKRITICGYIDLVL